jgi:hypothetical protein
VSAPAVVSTLATPAAAALAELTATFEELQTVLGCCERLIGPPAPDEVVAEALWTTALLSYARCFAGERLSVADVTGTGLEGEVGDWHGLLLRLRDHYADPVVDPRERFTVGVSRNTDGSAAGIAVTSVRQPRPDEVTVRQTGALAYALLRLVDTRITAAQQTLFTAAAAMPSAALDRLPEVRLSDVRLSD